MRIRVARKVYSYPVKRRYRQATLEAAADKLVKRHQAQVRHYSDLSTAATFAVDMAAASGCMAEALQGLGVAAERVIPPFQRFLEAIPEIGE